MARHAACRWLWTPRSRRAVHRSFRRASEWQCVSLAISLFLYYLAALFTQLDHDLDCCCARSPDGVRRPKRATHTMENLNKLFFCRELYRRTGESSSKRVFGESCGFASL